MNKPKIITLVVASLLTVLVYDGAQCYGLDIPEWAKQPLQESKDREGVVEFFGKVVDQHGQPVVGALVNLNIEVSGIIYLDYLFPPIKLDLTTGTDGTFTVGTKGQPIKGHTLGIDRIFKEGYEANRNIWPDRNKYYVYTINSPRRFVPDKNNPEVFALRKKGASTFLFKEMNLRLGREVKDSGKPIGYDFIKRYRIEDISRLVFNDEPVTCDLQVKATFNTNDATWSVVLSPGTTTGGIIVSTQLLYEAPETGYQPEYVFTPEDRKPEKVKYIYLRSRDPAIYTRVEVEYIHVNPDFFSLWGKSVTNPYGDRNLEQATDLPYEVIKQLTDEVKVAFRQNQRPPEPDLQQLVMPAQVTLKPEALEISPGILTAFVRLPAGYPVSGITSATCDGAPAERMMPNEDGTEMIIKFRRKDIEAALAKIGKSIDIIFIVRGTWQGASGTNLFQGTGSIKKIVGAKK